MNNNVDLANFDKMLELAEFGAKRHNERRQNYFKVIIAYITLLALVKCHRLFRPQFRKVNPSFVARIP